MINKLKNYKHYFYFICRAIVGELDDDVDSRIDLSTIRADPLTPVAH